MESKVIGFVGSDSYDLIAYTAKTIHELGCSVIMLDVSELLQLACIYQGEFNFREVLDILGVALCAGIFPEQIKKDRYDYILVNYGHNTKGAVDCDELYCVTDYHKHNIRWLADFDPGNSCRYLVVRDRCGMKFGSKYVLSVLPNLGISTSDVYEIEDTEADVQAGLYLQHSASVKFNRVSQSIFEFVSHVLDVDFDASKIQKAWKAASRR